MVAGGRERRSMAAKLTSCSAETGVGVMASFVALPNARASWQRF